MKRVQLGDRCLEQETAFGVVRLVCPVKTTAHENTLCVPECVWFDIEDDGYDSYALCQGARVGEFAHD